MKEKFDRGTALSIFKSDRHEDFMALIFAAVQVQRDYRDVADVIRMCRLRIRSPEISCA